MIHLAILLLLSVHANAKDEISHQDQVKQDQAKIEEIRKALSQIELDSQQSKIDTEVPKISEKLPEIISSIDAHLSSVDQEITQFSSRLQNIKLMIEVANMKIDIEKKLRPPSTHSAEYTSQTIQDECEYQATVVSASSLAMRGPIIKILDDSLSKTSDLISTLSNHRSSIEDLRGKIQGGSTIFKALAKELTRVNLAISKSQEAQSQIEGFRDQVLTRYKKALDQRFAGRTAEISQMKAQTQICFNQTLALTQIQESLKKPQQQSTTPPAVQPVTESVPAHAVSIAK
jgi:hypothetical protein